MFEIHALHIFSQQLYHAGVRLVFSSYQLIFFLEHSLKLVSAHPFHSYTSSFFVAAPAPFAQEIKILKRHQLGFITGLGQSTSVYKVFLHSSSIFKDVFKFVLLIAMRNCSYTESSRNLTFSSSLKASKWWPKPSGSIVIIPVTECSSKTQIETSIDNCKIFYNSQKWAQSTSCSVYSPHHPRCIPFPCPQMHKQINISCHISDNIPPLILCKTKLLKTTPESTQATRFTYAPYSL